MKHVILLLGIAILLSACHKETLSMKDVGKLKDASGLDACGWVIEIEGENGETRTIEPTNLHDFDIELVEGTWVKFKYLIREDIGSGCMVGPIVDLTMIKKK